MMPSSMVPTFLEPRLCLAQIGGGRRDSNSRRVFQVAMGESAGVSAASFCTRLGDGWMRGSGDARAGDKPDHKCGAGVKAGAVQVRFNGMDEPVVPDAPDFMRSLDIEGVGPKSRHVFRRPPLGGQAKSREPW
jgi:hypothetical protein